MKIMEILNGDKDGFKMESLEKYETVILIKGLTTEKTRNEIRNQIESIIKVENIDKIDDVGKKQLAYPVKNNAFGFYLVFYWNGQKQEVKELEKELRQNDDVLKFLTIKVSD